MATEGETQVPTGELTLVDVMRALQALNDKVDSMGGRMENLGSRVEAIEGGSREVSYSPRVQYQGSTSGATRSTSLTLSPGTFHHLYNPTPQNTTLTPPNNIPIGQRNNPLQQDQAPNDPDPHPNAPMPPQNRPNIQQPNEEEIEEALLGHEHYGDQGWRPRGQAQGGYRGRGGRHGPNPHMGRQRGYQGRDHQGYDDDGDFNRNHGYGGG